MSINLYIPQVGDLCIYKGEFKLSDSSPLDGTELKCTYVTSIDGALSGATFECLNGKLKGKSVFLAKHHFHGISTIKTQ